jgi:glutamine amidotransferase
MITLVDLGMGNVRSVLRAIARATGSEESAILTRDPELIRKAERLVVPGQGHFGDGARALSGPLGEALKESVKRGAPYLGICLGLQLLFEESDEAPGLRGLGILPGAVRRLKDGQRIGDEVRKIPHMGWNQVAGTRPHPLVAHPLIESGAWYYFVHSFHAVPRDPSVIVATADYGEPVCAAVAEDNVFACQFHPEKSGQAGLELLRRFAKVE